MESGKRKGSRRGECRECGFTGTINEDLKCGDCEEGDKGARQRAITRNTSIQRDGCKHCNRRVTSKDRAIQCDGCNNWMQAACEKVGDDLLRQVEKEAIKVWLCEECSTQFKKSIGENKKLKEDNAEMKKELEGIKEKNEGMLDKIRRYEKSKVEEREQGSTDRRNGSDEELRLIKKQMEELQREVKEVSIKWKRMDEEIKDFIAQTVVDVIEERENKQKRVKNLVIYNVRESSAENSVKEQKEEDQAVCMDIFVNELKVEDVEIVEAVRLGKKEENVREDERKPRPLLVKISEVEKKWEIIKNAKKLKDTRKENYRRVFISPDLTPKERAEDKELREQLKQKREQGERGWYIKNRRLVRGNFN